MKRLDDMTVRFTRLIRCHSDLHIINKDGKFMVGSKPHLRIEIIKPHLVAFTILATRDTDPSDTGLELLSHDKFVVTHAGPPRFNWHLHTLRRGR